MAAGRRRLPLRKWRNGFFRATHRVIPGEGYSPIFWWFVTKKEIFRASRRGVSGREGREDFFQQIGEFEMEGARGGIEEGKKEGRKGGRAFLPRHFV